MLLFGRKLHCGLEGRFSVVSGNVNRLLFVCFRPKMCEICQGLKGNEYRTCLSAIWCWVCLIV
jgi:hypothetical protein